MLRTGGPIDLNLRSLGPKLQQIWPAQIVRRAPILTKGPSGSEVEESFGIFHNHSAQPRSPLHDGCRHLDSRRWCDALLRTQRRACCTSADSSIAWARLGDSSHSAPKELFSCMTRGSAGLVPRIAEKPYPTLGNYHPSPPAYSPELSPLYRGCYCIGLLAYWLRKQVSGGVKKPPGPCPKAYYNGPFITECLTGPSGATHHSVTKTCLLNSTRWSIRRNHADLGFRSSPSYSWLSPGLRSLYDATSGNGSRGLSGWMIGSCCNLRYVPIPVLLISVLTPPCYLDSVLHLHCLQSRCNKVRSRTTRCRNWGSRSDPRTQGKAWSDPRPLNNSW